MVEVIVNIWETAATKSYLPAFLLFEANKFLEKLANNKLVNHLEK